MKFTKTQWIAIGGSIIVPIFFGTLLYFKNDNPTQQMISSPGGVQINGNNNVVNTPKAQLHLDYYLIESSKQQSELYSNNFKLIYSSQEVIKQETLSLKQSGGLNCQKPIKGKESNNVGGKYDGMYTVEFFITCTSTQLIPSNVILFKI